MKNRKFEMKNEIQVNINGTMEILRFLENFLIVEKPENNNTEISLEGAKALNKEKKLGEKYYNLYQHLTSEELQLKQQSK